MKEVVFIVDSSLIGSVYSNHRNAHTKGNTEMEKIMAKVQPLSIKVLKEMAIKLNQDLSSEATIVLDAVLEVLMGKVSEDEFVAFADSL